VQPIGVDYPRRKQEEYAMTIQERIKALAPSNAQAVIFAELEHDACDIQTDYFNVTTSRTAVIGFRTGSREDFRQLRRAAADFPETAHLGPGRDLWTARVVLNEDASQINGTAYWKDSWSHWHRDLGGENASFTTEAEARVFVAKAGEPVPISFQVNGVNGGSQLVTFRWDVRRESIEHRENYSMGAGNYLKAGSGYDSGWAVSSKRMDWLDHLPANTEIRLPFGLEPIPQPGPHRVTA
jgi:hypothetical protein